MNTNFSWADRLALIAHYNPPLSHAAQVFNVSLAEIKTALRVQNDGSIVESKIDLEQYANIFDPINIKPIVHKRRGRRGSKIMDAIINVPSTPVELNGYLAQHGIKESILRQYTRFKRTATDPVKAAQVLPIKIWEENGIRYVQKISE